MIVISRVIFQILGKSFIQSCIYGLGHLLQNYYLMPYSLQGQTRIFIKNKSDHFRTLVWYNSCYGRYTELDNYQQFNALFSPRTDQDFHLKKK